MIRICSNQEMREIDRIAKDEYLIDFGILMENAGRSAAQVILEEVPQAGLSTEILIFAGKGNNAGDAFVLARRLLSLERRVRVFHLEAEAGYKDETLRNFQILKRLKAKMTHLETIADLEAFLSTSSGPFTVVDGIVGTGLRGKLEGLFHDTVEAINRLRATQVIALDIPSGVSGDTGEVQGTSVMASHTITFGFPKLGHFLPPGAARRGQLINVDISLPARFRKEGDKYLLMPGKLTSLLQERDRYGHKNSFGHTLLIGGSPGRLGAITMAARACHRMGTGLVTVATWEEGIDLLLTKLPDETMAFPLKLRGPELENYKRTLPTYSSIVIGPGLGMAHEGRALIEALLSSYTGPMVLDADALNLIAEHNLSPLLVQRKAPTILTPHPGEMARLLKIDKDEIKRAPVDVLKRAVDQTHATVILKGAATLVGSPDDKIYLNHYPNDGMATAGSGDVLAGMIGGLVGQRMSPFEAALLGVYLHSLAGDLAARERGHRSMTASDIINNIGNGFKALKNTESLSAVESRLHLL